MGVQIIEAADLEENGGVYVLRDREAIPVRGVTAADRAVIGGTAVPVYVVTDAQINAGRFRVSQRAAQLVGQLTDLVISRTVRGRAALPVYVVNSDDWPTFSPDSISGLLRWFDMSDQSRLFTDTAKTTPVSADLDPIGAVEDKSGNGNDATQTGGNRPIYRTNVQNGLSIARFDGVSHYLNMPASVHTQGEFFVVSSHGDTSTGVILGHSVNVDLIRFNNNALNHRIADGTIDILVNTTNGDTSVFHLLDASMTATTVNAYVNGVTAGNDTHSGSSMSFDLIGVFNMSALWLNGDIGEILIYDHALTSEERTSIQNYLMNKWGI